LKNENQELRNEIEGLYQELKELREQQLHQIDKKPNVKENKIGQGIFKNSN
jgi:hypothetical protein